MKQYLLSVHFVEGAPEPTEEEMQTVFRETALINDEMQAAGAWVFGGGLRSPDTATVVRNDNGATTMSDGPFAETKEHIAGFWVIKCADLDEALAWAEKCAAACGPVEVRPFDDLSQA
ncbi:YciI family protein [Verrucosispora sp. WMMC514]|uniref:YciI family protein n=1 Tax=Verrucosispora sp. WMMC514 TaxID=3015156 RepID=UPI00248B2683|nr:YciI family protein [Verrucosispora sp. WMMC514]WBB89995.1 YciI family protein [Verrucosispora sp. WMMC514]